MLAASGLACLQKYRGKNGCRDAYLSGMRILDVDGGMGHFPGLLLPRELDS
jgi:hypothetical protein